MADSLQSREQLGEWLRANNYKRVVEIGAQRGDFARHLLNTWDGELVLIDAWRQLDNYRDIANVSDAEHADNFAAARRVIGDFPDRAHIVRGVSPEVAAQFPDGYFDAIYLDANHSKDAVLADLAAWAPKVRAGGAYIGHDYVDGDFPEGVFGVKSAVQEFFGREAEIVTEEKWPSWIIRKPASAAANRGAASPIPRPALVPAPINAQNAADVLRYQAGYARLCAAPALTGRGVVICGGGRYAASAWVTIKMLRHLGCNLPVQVWYLGPAEMPAQLVGAFARLGAETVDAYELRKQFPHKRLNGWEVKAYCLLHCPWREVMLLDADNIPLQNIEKLFDDTEYQQFGALFWPDRGRWPPDAHIWTLSGLPYRDEAEFETGQMVIDRQRCWPAVVMSNLINEDSSFWYSHIHGDKDTFRLAWRSLNMTYGMIPHMGTAPWPFFYQKDRAGQLLFHHGYKWDGKAANNQPFGADTPVIGYSDVCFSAIREFETALTGPQQQKQTPGRTAVLQFAAGPALDLFKITEPVHRAACAKYGYDFIVETEPKTNKAFAWEKARMCRDALLAGYDNIVWLDCDAFWLGNHELLTAWNSAPATAFFAATYHTVSGAVGQGHAYDHYNNGVFFLRNVPGKTLEFIEQWLAADDEGHVWKDQHAMHKVIAAQPACAYKLPHTWNSIDWVPEFRDPNPAIVAWHGRSMYQDEIRFGMNYWRQHANKTA